MKKLVLALLFLTPAAVGAQSIDLIYAGDTYTPPFYQGGTLWSGESMINFIAIPQGLGNPASLNYKWTKNGTVLGGSSGIGQNTLRFKDSIFSKPQSIDIEIVNGDDEVLASASANVVPTSPDTLIYEKHPLYGFLFNREASPSYQLTAVETTFAAFPLFFSTVSRTNPSLTYSWRSPAGQDSAESMVTYRTPEGASGQATIAVKVTNPTTIRQTTEKRFLIQFNNEN